MPVYTDGNFPSGCPVLAINGANYKCNEFSINPSSEVVQITDENGAHSGAIAFDGPLTGSAEVQFSAANVAEPNTAAASLSLGRFVANIGGGYAGCFITGVEITKGQRGPWVAGLSWQQVETLSWVLAVPDAVAVQKVAPTPNTNVSIVAYPIGGTAPYTYSWTGAGTSSTNTFTGSFTTIDSSVTCLVTDATGKTASVEVPIVIELL